jgi:predicted amidohydrolase
LTACGVDQKANLEKGEKYCRLAAAMGADIALFPEMWNIGYTLPQQNSKRTDYWWELAVDTNGGFVEHFKKLAKELNMAIAITYLEKREDDLHDSVSVIDRHGEICLTYAKVHTCDFDLEKYLIPGTEFLVCDLDTKSGPVKTGAMICFDREFPESARILMLKGAEIILVPNACTLDDNRLGQFRARAFENMLGVAMANYAAPQYNGLSVAFDGIVYAKVEKSRNTLIVQADEKEGVYLADFDLDALREYRQREVWGNAFRKPATYKLLTSKVVNEPFVRKNDTR